MNTLMEGWVVLLASLLVAAVAAGAMAAFDAPTWAWLGAGIIVYLESVGS